MRSFGGTGSRSGLYWVSGSPRILAKRLKQHEKDVIRRMHGDYVEAADRVEWIAKTIPQWQNHSWAARDSITVDLSSFLGYYWDIRVFHDMGIFYAKSEDFYNRRRDYLPHVAYNFPGYKNQIRSFLYEEMHAATEGQWSR